MAENRYDDVFMGLAREHGGIKELLTTFFGFLHRNTDFYVVMPPEGANMGFREGVAESMVIEAFHQFPLKRLGSSNSNSAEVQKKKERKAKQVRDNEASEEKTSIQGAEPKKAELKTPIIQDGKQRNGGIGPNYFWTQSVYELNVYITLLESTTSRDLNISILANRISVQHKGDIILEGEFEDRINHHESMWTLEEGKSIVISLQKIRQTWWKSVIKGHPEIDTTKVDSTKRVDEYDEETQAAIRKIMFEQQQKAMGNPTPEEIEMNQILEQASKLPNSPI